MDDWLDRALVGGLYLTIAAGLFYAFTLLPIGQQTIWGNSGREQTQAEKNEIAECLILFDDINNGSLQDIDFGKAEACKKKVGIANK